MDRGVDEICRMEVNGVVGREGGINERGTRNMIGRYGVLYLVCNLVKIVGIIGERGIENKKGVEVMKNGFKGVNIGMIIGIGNRGNGI